jgi:Na+/H+-dicarboxylate symporter
LTTAIAISLALACAVMIGRDEGLASPPTPASKRPPASLVEVLIGIFPRNVVAAMSQGNMLQIIVFAILFASP